MRIYNMILKCSVTAAIAVVILLLTLATVLAVVIQSAIAILLCVSAISFVTGAMGMAGAMIWFNRMRIQNPKFLARAEEKAREKDRVISATIISKTDNRGGAEDGIPEEFASTRPFDAADAAASGSYTFKV